MKRRIEIDQIKTMDLHMHTVVSDGTDQPEEIIGKVKNAGLSLFAVSDHDAYLGCQRVAKVLGEDSPYFLYGIEFSCKDEGGKYHILGYGYDPEAEAIRKVVESGHSLRILKTKARLEFLEEQFGFVFSQEDKEALFALDNPGKPHIANLMIRYGYASTKEEAIKTYIDQKRFRSSYVRPEAAIEGILKSGGIPVLAHPSYGSGGEMILGSAMDERLRHLLFYGLQGVEAYYSGFTKRLQEEMLSFAEKYDLYVTAGSDYHGRNKLVQLGENNLAQVSQGATGLHRFLRDVQDRIL